MKVQSQVLNSLFDYSDLVSTPRREVFAYCDSFRCGGPDNVKMQKSIIGKPTNCPDCGSALFYSKASNHAPRSHR